MGIEPRGYMKLTDVSIKKAKPGEKARVQLAQGIDPTALKKAKKAAGIERAANSFEVVAREWFEAYSFIIPSKRL